MDSMKNILVYWDHLASEPMPFGILSAQCIRNKEIFSFIFDDGWLKRHPDGNSLCPELQFYSGRQYTDKVNYGLFLDASPDRWGRKLMMRRETMRARNANEKPRVLLESDFLLGVYDETRMGALRFKLSDDGDFMNNDLEMAAPPWTYLRELEEASRMLENDAVASKHEKWLSVLLAPGSSLGGARPKASVTSPDGELWIAKFPSQKDEFDISAWEFSTMLMARDAGLNTPAVKLGNFSKQGATFLCKRFDRLNGQRMHFASAMNLLGKIDGDKDTSYLELAEFIIGNSPKPKEDLHELWKRIVFSIAVSNTDDHLRNHGFLLAANGWRLSPIYDVNPNPGGKGLSLNINENDNGLDFDLALEIAPYFRLDDKEANNVLNNIRHVVSKWRGYAKRNGISNAEIESMAPAFLV